jgi:ribokinase
VNTSLIERDGTAPTGTAVIGVDASRQNRIIVIPGANGTFTAKRLERASAILAQADFVLLQLEIPMETVEAAAALAKKGGARVILDPAPAAPLSPLLLRNVDYLTPNLNELAALTGKKMADDAPLETVTKMARTLCDRGAGRVVAKLGERGAVLVSLSAEMHWQTFPVTPVDTTAAGDCFNAAFAAALVAGRAEAEAGRFACAAAAISVTRAGAQPAMPSRAEVDRLLSQ